MGNYRGAIGYDHFLALVLAFLAFLVGQEVETLGSSPAGATGSTGGGRLPDTFLLGAGFGFDALLFALAFGLLLFKALRSLVMGGPTGGE